jgi:septal ring factor EnvC (AmiA/AmiB activator)
MRFDVQHAKLIAKVQARLCMLLALVALLGCQWLSPGSSDGDPESRKTSELADEYQRLNKQVKSQELDLAKLRAEYQRQLLLNTFLEEELDHLKTDLEHVERQFVTFEKRLQVKETKASAVAAIAEVQLLFDKLQKSETDPLDSLTVSEVSSKLELSEDLMRIRNYAASVYYANRAMRILNQTERKRNMVFPDGDAKIVVVFRANVRTGPGLNYRVVSKLEYGSIIVQLDMETDWSRIRTQSGQTGWVHNSLLR